MTTLRGGTRPRCSTGSGPVTSRMAVDAVSTTPAPMTASRPTRMPSTMTAREPTKHAVLDDDRLRALGGSSTPPMPTPPGKVAVAPDLRARADRGPGVDHRARADARADVHVAGIRMTPRSRNAP